MKQSNRKTPMALRVASVLFGALLVTTHLLSGIYARYSSQVSDSDTIQVASFGHDVFAGGREYINLAVNVKQPSIFVVADEFTVENTGEVTFSYALNLKLSARTGGETYENPVALPHGSLMAPVRGNDVDMRYICPKNNSTDWIQRVEFADICGKTYTAGRFYYGESADGVNYTWVVADSATIAGQLKWGETRYYKVLYFFDYSNASDLAAFGGFTPTSLLYSITCTQVD
jgi:hypothetical protein